MKLTLLVMAVLLTLGTTHGQTQATITWTNAGGYLGTCLDVVRENGKSISGNYYYCPWQASEDVSPNYVNLASLYLPDLTLESISVARGAMVVTSRNADGSISTWKETDALTGNNGGSQVPVWTGTTTQNFARTYSYNGGRCRCQRTFTDHPTGGDGTISSQVAP